ncbi:hypothetical protein NJC38_27965 [Pseudomonas sp. 21LCFQ010]|uniref:hypothetical protein n=1 Tax=Pseudomonas sp. 21LCFQ010 TaxID=2957506 RepID=UPI00209853BE|nr:hypothetical protein [Pseudomonas sp. 21LCFQ010]MCO8165970.1 hypothetical protein [Pseudomonas sp. 21LCFQ010]
MNDKRIAVVATAVEAAARLLEERVDNGLERHVEAALGSSAEYQTLRNMMSAVEPTALSAYQGSFTEQDWISADAAIKSNGVEMAEGQFLFDSVEKVDFSGNVMLSLASSKNLLTTVKWPFGTSLTVAAVSMG